MASDRADYPSTALAAQKRPLDHRTSGVSLVSPLEQPACLPVRNGRVKRHRPELPRDTKDLRCRYTNNFVTAHILAPYVECVFPRGLVLREHELFAAKKASAAYSRRVSRSHALARLFSCGRPFDYPAPCVGRPESTAQMSASLSTVADSPSRFEAASNVDRVIVAISIGAP